MVDRSSRPHRCPNQLPRRTERRIVKLRVTRRWGPARIAYHLGLNPSTVHQVLRRYGCPRLKWTDPATGDPDQDLPRDKHRYEHAAPGDLVHVDIKKLGRIPDGGGWRVRTGRTGQASARSRRAARAGASPRGLRLPPPRRRRPLPAGLLRDPHRRDARRPPPRSGSAPTRSSPPHGITVKRGAHRQRLLLPLHGCGPRRSARRIKHQTHPALPAPDQRQGRAVQPHPARGMGLRPRLPLRSRTRGRLPRLAPHYNHHRGHTALKGKSPIDRVPNLPGQNS